MQIHELNSLSSLGMGDFLAVDNGQDTGKVSVSQIIGSVSQDVMDLSSDLADETNARVALEERVNTLTTHKVAQPLDANEQPTNGTSGQSLRTKGDGTTEWADVGLPTDEQTAQAVSDWLDEHPEASTTIQDGAVTPVKLNAELYKAYKESGSVLYFFPNLTEGGYSGNCSLIVTPSKTILMDCGPATDWPEIQTFLNDLYSNGIFSNIDYIVISHYHYDHIQNLDSILSIYPHNNCYAYIPMNPAGYSTYDVSANRASVLSALTSNSVPYTEVDEVTIITIDDEFTSMELFNSTVADYTYYASVSPAIYNNFSMCALFKCGNMYSLFPGDIQRAAQIRIMDTRELPRLFLYAVHHHGIQNDDYRPYLETIEPEYSIIMTSHNRALQSAASSFSGNYLSGQVGSTGFSAYSYVSDKDSGSIIGGLTIPKIGWFYSYVDLYVDNSYSGSVYDGTEDHPFTEINEALMFVNQSSNLHYRVYVKGTTQTYGYVWVRDMNVALEIIGVKGANDNYPSIDGAYLRNCNSVDINNCIFDGAGRSINSHNTVVYAWATTHCAFRNCIIDGSNAGNDVWAIQIREGHLYISGCTVRNVATGISTYREGSITSSATTFNTVTSGCYFLANLKLMLRGKDVVTNCPRWISGNPDTGRPFVAPKNTITAALLALNSASAVSEPFYYSSAIPVAICSGTKAYNVLTGAEVTI